MSFMIQQSTQTHSQEVRKMWGHIYLHVADFVKWLTVEWAIWEFRVVVVLKIGGCDKTFLKVGYFTHHLSQYRCCACLVRNPSFLTREWRSSIFLFIYFLNFILESTFKNLTNLYSANPLLMAGLLECKPLSTLPWAVWFVQVTLEQK